MLKIFLLILRTMYLKLNNIGGNVDILKREEIGYDEQCPKVINIGVKKNV